jgi:hypothetical protein
MDIIMYLLKYQVKLPESVPAWLLVLLWFLFILHTASLSVRDHGHAEIKKMQAQIERLRNYHHVSEYTLQYDKNLISEDFKEEHSDYNEDNYDYQG